MCRMKRVCHYGGPKPWKEEGDMRKIIFLIVESCQNLNSVNDDQNKLFKIKDQKSKTYLSQFLIY